MPDPIKVKPLWQIPSGKGLPFQSRSCLCLFKSPLCMLFNPYKRFATQCKSPNLQLTLTKTSLQIEVPVLVYLAKWKNSSIMQSWAVYQRSGPNSFLPFRKQPSLSFLGIFLCSKTFQLWTQHFIVQTSDKDREFPILFLLQKQHQLSGLGVLYN